MPTPDQPPVWVPVAMRVAAAGVSMVCLGFLTSTSLPAAPRQFMAANEPRMPWSDRL